MQVITCDTMQDVSACISRIWPIVIVMIVRGSLRHRIEQIGEEVLDADLTDRQRVLRTIAVAQGFRDDELLNGHKSRPYWGGGAFFYCEEAVVNLMKYTQGFLPFWLQSKHVVCSPQHEVAIRECLGDFDEGQKGREAFLKKRAGQVKDYHVVELPGYPMLDLTQVDSKMDADLMEYLMAPSGMQSTHTSRGTPLSCGSVLQRPLGDLRKVGRREHPTDLARVLLQIPCLPRDSREEMEVGVERLRGWLQRGKGGESPKA